MPSTGGANFEGVAIGFQITSWIWALEVFGQVSLPTTARAIVLRKRVPQGDPSVLQLDAIPAGEDGTTDVISDHPVGYIETDSGKLLYEQVAVFYGGGLIGSCPIKRP